MIEAAFDCDPPRGLRVSGFHDRWHTRKRIGFAVKTLLVTDRCLTAAVWGPQCGVVERMPLIDFEWGRVNLPVTVLFGFWASDRPDLAGAELVRRLRADFDRSRELRGVDRSFWAFLLRHVDGERVAYAELPVEPVDARRLRWSWIKTTCDDGEDDPIALEGEDDRGWRIRWFLRGGQVRVRVEVDRARLATFRMRRPDSSLEAAA